MFNTYMILSWHQYQRVTPSHLQTIDHYNQTCAEGVRSHGDHVMVLRDNVTQINGYYWYSNGFAAQNCADTCGYVDVRTGKHYDLNGENSFFKDMHK